MKEYLKMSDCFEMPLDGSETNNGRFTMLDSGGSRTSCEFACDAELEVALHAINSHDELVAEVERLRGALQDAFIEGCHYGWDMSAEGYNAEYGGPDDGAIHDMFATASIERIK